LSNPLRLYQAPLDYKSLTPPISPPSEIPWNIPPPSVEVPDNLQTIEDYNKINFELASELQILQKELADLEAHKSEFKTRFMCSCNRELITYMRPCGLTACDICFRKSGAKKCTKCGKSGENYVRING
jgi:hypothetical protein